MIPPLDVPGAVMRQSAAEVPGAVTTSKLLLLLDMDNGQLRATYPAGHQPGRRVPKGGASCSNCKSFEPALNGAPATCKDPNFITWDGGATKPSGSAVLPQPQDEFASDWWQPA